MKKVLFATILLVVFLAPSLVAVQGADNAPTVSALMDKITKQIIIPIFYGLAVICIIVSGIMFLTAAGDPEKLGKAKKAFMWGVIGIAIGLVSDTIYSILAEVLG
ncbi:TrbC/VirB2 family protein [Patescibacteria group bacterium]|nr:TrbC/VirB2 family protein [Patescibacteria group bacterium]